MNQSVWDLTGVSLDVKVVFVQAKMGGEAYANDVQERMLENPDVMFATSTEIQEKILEKSPELPDQFITVYLSNMEFSTEVADGASQLVANAGLDVPDSFGHYLPFVGEVEAALTLHKELIKLNFYYAQISDLDRRTVKALRAIHVAGKYAAFSGGAASGAALGTALLPVVGTILGGIGGFAYMKWIKNDIVAEQD